MGWVSRHGYMASLHGHVEPPYRCNEPARLYSESQRLQGEPPRLQGEHSRLQGERLKLHGGPPWLQGSLQRPMVNLHGKWLNFFICTMSSTTPVGIPHTESPGFQTEHVSIPGPTALHWKTRMNRGASNTSESASRLR
jgi:hypothetical protein